MKRVAEVLGVSRSNLVDRRDGKSRPRGSYRKSDDEDLLPLIRRFVDERPTYGYRRITALVNRELTRKGLPVANRKRVHRIMQQVPGERLNREPGPIAPVAGAQPLIVPDCFERVG